MLCAPFFDEATESYGYRGCDGSTGIPATLIAAEPFNACGIAAVLDNSGWRYIDRTGTTLLRPKIMDNGPDPFSEGLARYVENGKYGFFDECGAVVIPAQYDFALPFNEGSAKAGYECTFTPEPPFGEYSTYECERWTELEHPRKAR